MAGVLNSLARTPTGPEQFGPFTSLMQIENRIAAGLLDAQTLRDLHALGTPLAGSCHICGAPARQLLDARTRLPLSCGPRLVDRCFRDAGDDGLRSCAACLVKLAALLLSARHCTQWGRE
jgi:bacterioferritin-associated ferredoxin